MQHQAKQLIVAIEKAREQVFEAHNYIWTHPETGYREWKTSKYLEDAYEKLGYSLVRAGNIPGFYTDLDTGKPGPTVLILAELDSLICEAHPDASPSTHYVHACGHSAQCAALLGLAIALKQPRALDGLSGKIRLMMVPAEELIELSYREELKQQGIIHYFGGKTEFMYRGYMDDVDLAFMVHTDTCGTNNAYITKGSNGCIAKTALFKGKASHAGVAPEDGINALYAATQATSAINALRETFRDQDCVRVHPIITKGGNAVNAIPDDVCIENYVRGASINLIKKISDRINLAVAGSAASIGAQVELIDQPGYAPLINDEYLNQLALEAMRDVLGPGARDERHVWEAGCTDMGDLSTVMPVVQPYCGGAEGTCHGKDFYIHDLESACINSAKIQAILLVRLLENDAVLAKRIIQNATPLFASIPEYFAFVDKLTLNKKVVQYNPDGTVTLDYKN